MITGVKLEIKEKRQERSMHRKKNHIGNKWWKIMTIYCKEMKTTRRRIEGAIKESREEFMLMGEDFNGGI
jgi:hypothetical protein